MRRKRELVIEAKSRNTKEQVRPAIEGSGDKALVVISIKHTLYLFV